MKKYILIITIILIQYIQVFSQESLDSIKNYQLNLKEPVGTDFWLCFMTNFKDDPKKSAKNELLLELFITSDKNSTITIEIAALNYKKVVYIEGGTVQSIQIDNRAQILSSEVVIQGLSVHVTSDNPINIFGLNRRYQTTDTYLALPINVLGNEYRAICYHLAESLASLFAIVATEDNTIVEITPTTLTSTGHLPNKKFEITLNKGDVYQVKSESSRVKLRSMNLNDKDADLTGSLIKANKNIAFFSGHECTYVPVGPPIINACNHLVEQIPPLSSWGKHFYIGRMESRSMYSYRVLANNDNTKVFEDSKLVATLSAGKYFEKQASGNIQITADKPVLVAQYSQGFNNGDKVGDPMMLLISPTQQFLKKYRFATPVNGSWNHYISVVIPREAINSLTLDGARVSPFLFEPLGLSRYSIAQIEVDFGTHSISATEPFGMYSYGFGFGEVDAYDAYGNMGGQSFLEYIPKKDTLPPILEFLSNNDKETFILRDDRIDDSGLSSLRVLDSGGVNLNIPRFSAGVLQIELQVTPTNINNESRLVIEAFDVYANSQIYTICYKYDEQLRDFTYTLSYGINNDCISKPVYNVGVFGKYSLVFHNSHFSNSGNIKFDGYTSDAIGTGGYFGFYIGKKIINSLAWNAKLSLENYSGTLSAPDSNIIDNSEFKLSQEEFLLKNKSLYMNVALGLDYSLMRNFYLNLALNFGVRLNNSIELSKRIISPVNVLYPNNSNIMELPTDEMTSLKSILMAISFGFGTDFSINKYINPFIEVHYNYYPFNIIDENWNINSLSIIFGLKYTL